MTAVQLVTKRWLGAVAGLALALALAPPVQAANTYQVREAPYVAPPEPGPDETLIYVIREPGDLGGFRKFAIIDNDTVVAVLTPGSFSWFVVPSGQHEIVAYVSPSPIMHYRVVPSPGRTVYLLCKAGYTAGLFMTPIEREQAEALMAKLKYTEIGVKGAKAKMDYKAYYDNLFR